jgi:hypothetical protein
MMHFLQKSKKTKDMTVRQMIDLVDDLIKKHGKENVLTTLKSIIDFYEKNA